MSLEEILATIGNALKPLVDGQKDISDRLRIVEGHITTLMEQRNSDEVNCKNKQMTCRNDFCSNMTNVYVKKDDLHSELSKFIEKMKERDLDLVGKKVAVANGVWVFVKNVSTLILAIIISLQLLGINFKTKLAGEKTNAQSQTTETKR